MRALIGIVVQLQVIADGLPIAKFDLASLEVECLALLVLGARHEALQNVPTRLPAQRGLACLDDPEGFLVRQPALVQLGQAGAQLRAVETDLRAGAGGETGLGVEVDVRQLAQARERL